MVIYVLLIYGYFSCRRILRSLQLQAQGRLSRLFQRWKSQLFIANHDQTTNELLRVKRENWELQQQLKELIGTDKIREDYLLERTLNRLVMWLPWLYIE